MRLVPSALVFLAFGCGATPHRELPSDSAPIATCVPPADSSAPKFSELFERYFAPGTPGHCATAHCHGNPGANEWVCGDSPDTCYRGMVQVGLIDAKNPAHSAIADPKESPLIWVNPSGDMPFDATTPLPEGRDAIVAWVAACAPND
jgi:hypothetical protein